MKILIILSATVGLLNTSVVEGTATPDAVDGEDADAMLYDAAALSSNSLETYNFNFNRDVVRYATGPQCYHDFTALPANYPNMCAMGARENTNANSTSGNAQVQTRRTQNLRDICNNDTSRGNKRALNRLRDKEGELILRDQNITQKEENEFAVALGSDPNFVPALRKLTGPPRGDAMSVAMAGLCEVQARQTVDFRFGRGGVTSPSLRLGDRELDDRLLACMRVSEVSFTGIIRDCNIYNVTVTASNVRTLFECGRGTSGPPHREVSLCQDLNPPPGGSVAECRRLDEERYQRQVTRYWVDMIPSCQARYTSEKAACLRQNREIEAARERRATTRRAEQQACETRVRAERQAELARLREEADAAYARAFETEVQNQCFAPEARINKRLLCEGGRAMQYVAACNGVTNRYDLMKETLPTSHPSHPDNNTSVINAKTVLAKIKIFRENYNNVFNPENRDADCMTRIGYRSICDLLKNRMEKDNQRMNQIYSDENMRKFKEEGERLKVKYREAINRMLPGTANSSKRQKLFDRLDKVRFTRPQGNAELFQINNFSAMNNCIAAPNVEGQGDGFHECSNSTISLAPSLMLEMGTEAGQARMRSVLLHELGHTVAPDFTSSENIFRGLVTCLGNKININSYSSELHKYTVKKEAVADWLSAEVSGSIIADDATASADAKKVSVANQIDHMMCTIIGPPSVENCQTKPDGTFRFENDPEIQSEPITNKRYVILSNGSTYYCNPGEFTYPSTADRFAIFTRSSGLRRALGCNDPTSGPGTRVQSCSL